MRYRNDQWTLEDSLGMGRAGDQVARMALEVKPPFTLGVTGKWGAGKTSVLRWAFATLGGKPISQAVPLRAQELADTGDDDNSWENLSFTKRSSELDWNDSLTRIAQRSLCIWYSPWQHQNADNPLVPLLLEIRQQFTAWAKVKEKAKNFNRDGGLAALTLLQGVADAGISLATGRPSRFVQDTSKAIRDTWREAEPDLTQLSDGQRFHLLFEDAVKNVLGFALKDKEKIGESRLIIFIDDLDRCEESVVVSLLESIKLYLGSKYCIFVLGIDDTAVLGALRRYWKDRNDEDNREYLEKLFQATVAVPLPRQQAIHGIIEEQLKNHCFPDAELQQCINDIEQLLEPNPRKLKNFLNSLCATWNLYGGSSQQDSEHARRFIMFHYLRLYHRAVWRLLERQPWALCVLHQVLIGSKESINGLPQYIAEADQAILKEVFTRAFSHVLCNDLANTDPLRHRKLTLDQAVKLFEERIDRKRSDEYFIGMFKDLVAKDYRLQECFLHLPE